MNLLTYGLAVYRLSRMLTLENGPCYILRRLRERTGIEYFGDSNDIVSYPEWNPLYCPVCTSIWVAIALYFAPAPVQRVLAASAISTFLSIGEEDGS